MIRYYWDIITIKGQNWYVEILGEIPDWKSEKGEYQCVKFGDTSITLFLTNDHNYFRPSRSSFNFYVPDAQLAFDYLRSNGVRVEEVKEYGAKNKY